MAQPDGRLVYLHCSSIFSGANAHVRRAKKITQLLQQHKAAIKILTNEFSLSAVATVAKELLEEQIFESLPRAKLRYPELFQPSETQEAGRAVSDIEIIRIETDAMEDAILTFDKKGGAECPDLEQGEQIGKPDGISEDKVEVADEIRTQILGQRKVQGFEIDQTRINHCDRSRMTSQTYQASSVPRLHPVYLPFKTQHAILVLVQHLLEECCLDFGNTWVPDLMKARRWEEAESIELTQWTKRFSRHAKSLPPSAFERIPGKSLDDVLFGTSSLRHSAVHRLPTSAVGICKMLSAALDFTGLLKDSQRAARVMEIRTQLLTSVEEISQHQNLLECKLTAQLEDIARQRAELDQLERSSVEAMLASDKQQRKDIGSIFESFLHGSQPMPDPCNASPTPAFDKTKIGPEVGEGIDSRWNGMFLLIVSREYPDLNFPLDHEAKFPAGGDRVQAAGQRRSNQDETIQAREPKDHGPSLCYTNSASSVAKGIDVLGSDNPDFWPTGRKENCQETETSSWANHVPDKTSFSVEKASAPADISPSPGQIAQNNPREWPRNEAPKYFTSDSKPTRPDQGPREAAEACSKTMSETPLPTEHSYAEQNAICREKVMQIDNTGSNATRERLPLEPYGDEFDNIREITGDRENDAPDDTVDPREPSPEPDIAPSIELPLISEVYPLESAQADSPVRHPTLSVRAKCGSDGIYSLAPSSTASSESEATAPVARKATLSRLEISTAARSPDISILSEIVPGLQSSMKPDYIASMCGNE
ncbi:MAG: hypothetical protein Q9169_007310 [Polycauliona sp. 2 TL-2023]